MRPLRFTYQDAKGDRHHTHKMVNALAEMAGRYDVKK